MTEVGAVVDHLLTPAAIRERCGLLLAEAEADRLEHFGVDWSRLDAVAERVEQVTRASYPDLSIPYHSRWQHFSVGGVDRCARLRERLPADLRARGRALFDLVITSVLLDAGAGPDWSYASDGERYARSEGLAVASFDLFVAGRLSSDADHPLQADVDGLQALTADDLGAAFQVGPENRLVGLAGRAALLQRLGAAVAGDPVRFGCPRPGALFDTLYDAADDGALPATAILDAVLRGLGSIWPGRASLGGVNLGDVWPHPALSGPGLGEGLVPFHKLSQWLTYSLLEPLEESGLTVTGLDDLTGLPEYRNGGLLLDLGLLVAKHNGVTGQPHAPGDPVIVEWRALTVALLDRVAAAVRERLGLSAAEFPLAKVLQGGTWAAGRAVAAERRPGGQPPIQITSDGTVF